jgi:DNA-binding NtrC family response regulator
MTPEEQDVALSRIRDLFKGRHGPINVLLVEDEANDYEQSEYNLKRFGVKTGWARDAAEVQNYLSFTNPWLIFLDMKLKKASGLEVLDLIMSIRPESRVVILTGHYRKDSEECEQALMKGAISIMLKPLTDAQIRFIFDSA